MEIVPVLRHSDAGQGNVEEHPATFDALISRLAELSRQYEAIVRMPYAVDLVREGVGVLSVGLGTDEWMLSIFDAEGEMIKNSLGDRAAIGETSFYFGDHTLISRKYLVPKDAALEVVRLWWEKGEISSAIQWTDEIF